MSDTVPPTPTELADLAVPELVKTNTRDVIRYTERHLQRAVSERDAAAALTHARALCEAVAKAVLNSLAITIPNKLGAQVHEVQRALTRHPADLGEDEQLRTVAGSLAKIVTELGAARNEHGNAHGHADLVEMGPEVVFVAAGAALLWCRWVLDLLPAAEAATPLAIVRELQSENFYSGGLAQRLDEVHIPTLDPLDQRRVGLAVGRRAARGTFTVYNDGVTAVLDSNATTFPEAYIQGVLTGLLVSDDGRVRLHENQCPLTELALKLGDAGTPTVNELADDIEGKDHSMATPREDGIKIADRLVIQALTTVPPGELRTALFGLSESIRGVFDPEGETSTVEYQAMVEDAAEQIGVRGSGQ